MKDKQEYKTQADKVLLVRGNGNAIPLTTNGKSESQIFDMLVALKKNIR